MDIKKLEAWYVENYRDLPFRKTQDPYTIWVSEIMLQQTQVETVLPFFESFMKKYPNVQALAKADIEILRKDVEGIGYYRRFKLMHEAAQVIVNQFSGEFPKTYEEILSLPGIGHYTAGAIMSIAYNKPYSALDGNVIRVLSRYYGIEDDFRIEKNKKNLNQINQKIIEKATPRIYTQALMELGAVICKPRQAKCELCPIQEQCFANQNQVVDQLPFLSKLKKQKEISYITLVIENEDDIYLNKRSEKLLEGMYEYPQYEAENIFYVLDQLKDDGIELICQEDEKTYRHVFSHQIWVMKVYKCRLLSKPHPHWIAIKKTELNHIPMGIAHRKIT